MTYSSCSYGKKKSFHRIFWTMSNNVEIKINAIVNECLNIPASVPQTQNRYSMPLICRTIHMYPQCPWRVTKWVLNTPNCLKRRLNFASSSDRTMYTEVPCGSRYATINIPPLLKNLGCLAMSFIGWFNHVLLHVFSNQRY